MTWRAAKSLKVWHAQLQALAPRAKPPATDPNAWGLRAGATHAQSGGHFPHHVPRLGDEIVTAADAPNAPWLGLDIHAELDAIRRSRDPRVLYAISNDQMFSSYAAQGYPPYTWRPYNPTDPSRDKHIEHGHLQVVDDARADGEQPWATAGAPAAATEEDDMNNYFRDVAGQPADVSRLSQGNPGYAGQQRDTALAFTWQAAHDANAGVQQLLEVAKLIATKVDIDPAELAQIEAAAKAGATAAFAEQRTQLVADIIAALPRDRDGNLSVADVETAVRAVFADAGNA